MTLMNAKLYFQLGDLNRKPTCVPRANPTQPVPRTVETPPSTWHIQDFLSVTPGSRRRIPTRSQTEVQVLVFRDQKKSSINQSERFELASHASSKSRSNNGYKTPEIHIPL